MGSNLTNTEKAEKEPNEFHFSWPICSVKNRTTEPDLGVQLFKVDILVPP